MFVITINRGSHQKNDAAQGSPNDLLLTLHAFVGCSVAEYGRNTSFGGMPGNTKMATIDVIIDVFV